MIFKKQDLYFLDLYNVCSDTKEFICDKTNIKAVGDKVFFSQYSYDIKFVTELENKEKETFDITLLTSSLSQMIKLCDDDSTIEITENGIKIGNSSNYQLESFIFDFVDPQNYVNISQEDFEEEYDIKDLKNIKSIKSFVGGQEEFNTISLQNNYYISYNDTILGVTSTKNNIEDTLYFPAIFLSLVQSLGIDELKLKTLQEGKFYSFSIGNTLIFVDIKQYGIPNIFDEDIKERYEHPYKVKIKKSIFSKALQRIRILTQFNANNRLFLNLEGNEIKLESRDKQKGFESVPAEIDDEIKNTYIVLDCNFLNSIVSLIKGDYIYIYSKKEDLKAVKITDEHNKDFFVHIKYKDNSYED